VETLAHPAHTLREGEKTEVIHTSKPANPRRGDFLIFWVSDQEGLENRAGRHTNQGYSGYFILTVWDGCCWARLTKRFESRLGLEGTAFEYSYEKPRLLELITVCLERYVRENPEQRVASWRWKGRKYADLVLPKPEPVHSP
jgi:hypothetical protein